ncbi:MAG: alanine dehydrogenase [Gammaproteobacteria bacterium]|nr:alanine dehydrogenase [Gammaproteobacteria bacterium]
MKIGIPTEIKTLEGRVGLTPDSCESLIDKGHEVYLQSGAGLLSGYLDADFERCGVQLLDSAEALYGTAELIVKVKEPVASELVLLTKDHLLFCFLHLAANPTLTRKLCEIGLTAVAFETVTDEQGRLPLLTPMSEIAGRLSIQIGTHLLHQPQGGRGVLLGGLDQTDKGHVVILGGGHAGGAAASLAGCMGAEVTVFDKNQPRIDALSRSAANITGRFSAADAIADAVATADLVVGAVLLPGLHAPRVVTEAMVKTMPSASVIIDISIDQGGCIETMRATDYQNPTYRLHDVLHFGVTNMPGAVPRTASQALSAAITPYVHRLCESGWAQDEDLRQGINIRNGKIDNPLIEQTLKAG